LETVDSAQHRAERLRLKNGRAVYDLRRNKRTTERKCWVVFGASGGDGESKDRANGLSHARSRLAAALRLDALQRG
jgi:hypothetical protein